MDIPKFSILEYLAIKVHLDKTKKYLNDMYQLYICINMYQPHGTVMDKCNTELEQ